MASKQKRVQWNHYEKQQDELIEELLQVKLQRKRLIQLLKFQEGELDFQGEPAKIRDQLENLYWFDGACCRYEKNGEAEEKNEGGDPEAAVKPEGHEAREYKQLSMPGIEVAEEPAASEKKQTKRRQIEETKHQYQIRISDKSWMEMLQNQRKYFLDQMTRYMRIKKGGAKLSAAKEICENVKLRKELLRYLLDGGSMGTLQWCVKRQDGEVVAWEDFPAVGLELLIKLGLAEFDVRQEKGCRTGILSISFDAGEYIDFEKDVSLCHRTLLEEAAVCHLQNTGYIPLDVLYQSLKEVMPDETWDRQEFERFFFFRLVFWGTVVAMPGEGNQWFAGIPGVDLEELRRQQSQWKELPYHIHTDKYEYIDELKQIADYLGANWTIGTAEIEECTGELEQILKKGGSTGEACTELLNWIKDVDSESLLSLWSGIYALWKTIPLYELKGHSREEAAKILGREPGTLVVSEPEQMSRRKARALWNLPLEIQEKAAKALEQIQEKQWEEALRLCREVLEVQPEQIETQYLLNEALLQTGNYAEAEKLTKALLKKGEAEETLLVKLIIIRGKSGDKQGLKALEDEYPQIFKWFITSYTYGVYLQKNGELEEAAVCFRTLGNACAGYENRFEGAISLQPMLYLFQQLLTMDYDGKEAWIEVDTDRYIQSLKWVLKECDEWEYEIIREGVGTTVIEYSIKLNQQMMRKPFLTLISYVERAGILAGDGYCQIVDTGYVAYESWVMHEDRRLDEALIQLIFDCEELYRNDSKMSLDEKREIKNVILLEEYEVLKDYPACLDAFDVIEKEYGYIYKRTIQAFAEKVRAAGNIQVLKDKYEKSIWKKGIRLAKEEEMQGLDFDFEVQEPVVRQEKKIGRNDPCPCGSGKKYKKCCGK